MTENQIGPEDSFERTLREVLEPAVEARAGLEGRVLARVAAEGGRGQADAQGWWGRAAVGGVLAGAVLAWAVGAGRAGQPATAGHSARAGQPARAGLGVGDVVRPVERGGEDVAAEMRPGARGGTVRVEERRMGGASAGRKGRARARVGEATEETGRAELPPLEVGELSVAPLVLAPLGPD